MNNSKKQELHKFFKINLLKYSFLISTAIPHTGMASVIPDNDVKSFTEQPRVGYWTEMQLPFFTGDEEIKHHNIRPLPDRPDNFIPYGQIIKMDTISAANENRALAICYAKDGSVVFSGKDSLTAIKIKNQETRRYLLGDPFAQNSVAYHEFNHSAHFKCLGIGAKFNTPVNAAKYKNMTENIAHIANYLSTAYQYYLLEKQGIKFVQINNKSYAIEYILEMYPGLLEIYKNYGFDLRNKEKLRPYVEAGIAYKNTAKSDYDYQCYKSYLKASAVSVRQKSFNTRFNEARTENVDFNKVSHLMVQKVYIGHNTCVNLSDFYNQINDMSTGDVCKLVETLSNGEEHVIPAENIVSIGDYLNNKGISNKGEYIAENFFLITEKDKNADLMLRDLMLQSQKEENKAYILYNDGTRETVYSDNASSSLILSYNLRKR